MLSFVYELGILLVVICIGSFVILYQKFSKKSPPPPKPVRRHHVKDLDNQTMFLKARWSRGHEAQKSSAEKETPSICPECVNLMSEIAEVKKQIASYENANKKHFSIAPTLYTYYQNTVIQQRISR